MTTAIRGNIAWAKSGKAPVEKSRYRLASDYETLIDGTGEDDPSSNLKIFDNLASAIWFLLTCGDHSPLKYNSLTLRELTCLLSYPFKPSAILRNSVSHVLDSFMSPNRKLIKTVTKDGERAFMACAGAEYTPLVGARTKRVGVNLTGVILGQTTPQMDLSSAAEVVLATTERSMTKTPAAKPKLRVVMAKPVGEVLERLPYAPEAREVLVKMEPASAGTPLLTRLLGEGLIGVKDMKVLYWELKEVFE